MTITRSLLSKLHLPYRQLGIEGSRGDQLYLPDDVGVNLSVLHGINSTGMEPVRVDSSGEVFTNQGLSIGSPSVSDYMYIASGLHVTADVVLADIDTSDATGLFFVFVLSNRDFTGGFPHINVRTKWLDGSYVKTSTIGMDNIDGIQTSNIYNTIFGIALFNPANMQIICPDTTIFDIDLGIYKLKI